MPIRKANAALYAGPEYAAFREYLRARAGDRCEMCGAKNGETYYFTASDADPEFAGALYWNGEVWISPAGLAVSPEVLHAKGSVLLSGPTNEYFPLGNYCRPITVVCGVSHTDHDPRHRDPERARFLCNRCHLTHDQKSNAGRRRVLKAARAGQLWLISDIEKAEMPEGYGA